MLIHIHRTSVPPGMKLQRNRSVGRTVPLGEGASEQAEARPAEVARYADGNRTRTSRMISVNRIDADDPASVLTAMTAEHRWQPWPSAHNGSMHTAGDGVMQIAWATAEVVIWVITTGLQPNEARTLVDGIDLNH